MLLQSSQISGCTVYVWTGMLALATPSWAGVWVVLTGLGGWFAPQEVHAKLLEEIDDEHIPVEYGGKDARHLYESDQEVAIWRLADRNGGQS